MANVPLHGEFNLRLDDKGRLTLPQESRAQMATSQSSALVARGGWKTMESAVWLFPDRQFETLCREQDDSDELGYDVDMLKLAVSSRLTLDKRGRVTIPERLLSYYGILAPEVTLIGVRNHFELWSRTGWCEHRAEQVKKAKASERR